MRRVLASSLNPTRRGAVRGVVLVVSLTLLALGCGGDSADESATSTDSQASDESGSSSSDTGGDGATASGGEAPDVSGDLTDVACELIDAESVGEIVGKAGAYSSYLGTGSRPNWGMCTFEDSESGADVTVDLRAEGVAFTSSFQPSSDGYTTLNFGDASYLRIQDGFGAIVGAAVDEAFIEVRVSTLDDNSDRDERAEDAKAIMARILQLS